jgi:hypothetical protein
MDEPITVWMVLLDGRTKDDVEGTLWRDDAGLVFTEVSGTVTRFPFREITKAKRVLGSPVFVIRHGPQRHETAFYLTKPPPLGVLRGMDRPGAVATTMSGRGRSGKWRQRRDNTRYLAATSSSLKDVRDEWVTAIRAEMQRGR